jgi:hypothetical protein
MKNRAPFVLLIILIAAAAGTGAWWCRPIGFMDEALARHGLQTDFSTFIVSHTKKIPVKQFEVTEISAREGETQMQVLIIPGAKDSFPQYLSQRIFLVESQFNRGASPYPGAVSQNTECPAEYKPVKREIEGKGWKGLLVTTFANSRKLFGVCETGERHFETAQLILLCSESGTIFDLTVFTRLGEKSASEALTQVKCGS